MTREYTRNSFRSTSVVDSAQGEKIIETGVHILQSPSSREEPGGPSQSYFEAVRWRTFGAGESRRRGYVSAHQTLRIGVVPGKAIRSNKSTQLHVAVNSFFLSDFVNRNL